MNTKQAKKPEPLGKRESILAAAGSMFMAHGYNAVSMEAIAEAAPVSKPTLYNHFGDKKALFAAVMQSRCHEVFEKLEQSLQGDKSVATALTEMGQQFLSVVLRPDALNIFRIAITESQNFPDLGQTLFGAGPLRSRAMLAEYLKKMDAQGILKVADPDFAAHAFFGMLLSRFQMPLLLRQRKDVTLREINDVVTRSVAFFLKGLAH